MVLNLPLLVLEASVSVNFYLDYIQHSQELLATTCGPYLLVIIESAGNSLPHTL